MLPLHVCMSQCVSLSEANRICAAENSKLGDDGVQYLRAVIGTCLNVIANLTKDCIEGIHVLENKRSDLRKLLQMKLAFSVEQTISFAKLVHEIQCLGQSKDNRPIYFTPFMYCTECIRTLLIDVNIQVNRYLSFKYWGEIIKSLFTDKKIYI